MVIADFLLDWFEPEELDVCPRCGDRRALWIADAGTTLCFGCGFVGWPGGETTVAAIQGRASGGAGVVSDDDVVRLLAEHGSLGYEQVSAHLHARAWDVRHRLASLRDRGLVDVLSIGELEGQTTRAASYWRLTDKGRRQVVSKGWRPSPAPARAGID